MILTEQERQSLDRFELILKNITAPDPLKAAAEEMTNDKLAGAIRFHDGIASRLVAENGRLSNDLMLLQSRFYSLESDFKNLLKVLNQQRGYNQDFENLKQKHYIY